MNTEAVLAAIVPAVAELIKNMVDGIAKAEAPTLYELEAQTHAVLPQIGRVLLQALVAGQGAGLAGPERACGCGGQQAYQDQHRPLSVATSLGLVRVGARACYQCPTCRARSYPVDEQLGLGVAGRMSRYQQEQVGWLLALLPVRLARQTLIRFDWPAVSASSIREQGEAAGGGAGGAAPGAPDRASGGHERAAAPDAGRGARLCSARRGDVLHDGAGCADGPGAVA